MAIINLSPEKGLIEKWGPLAYVDEIDRQCILGLPFGRFKPAVKSLEKQINLELKKKKETDRKNKEWEKINEQRQGC